jgi:excisionase family DNA binding protein
MQHTNEQTGTLVWNMRETAQRLKISVGHLRNLVRRGEIPYLRLGRRVVFHAQTIEVWLLRRMQTKRDSDY